MLFQVSFDDFECLFESEREATSKKQKFDAPIKLERASRHDQDKSLHSPSDGGVDGGSHQTSKIMTSSPFQSDWAGSENVVLRPNRRRMTMPSRLHRHDKDVGFLSPIQPKISPTSKRPPSSDVTGKKNNKT